MVVLFVSSESAVVSFTASTINNKSKIMCKDYFHHQQGREDFAYKVENLLVHLLRTFVGEVREFLKRNFEVEMVEVVEMLEIV